MPDGEEHGPSLLDTIPYLEYLIFTMGFILGGGESTCLDSIWNHSHNIPLKDLYRKNSKNIYNMALYILSERFDH